MFALPNYSSQRYNAASRGDAIRYVKKLLIFSTVVEAELLVETETATTLFISLLWNLIRFERKSLIFFKKQTTDRIYQKRPYIFDTFPCVLIIFIL